MKFEIYQPWYDPHHPGDETPCTIMEKNYSPTYGWRNFTYRVDGKPLIFEKRVDAEKWLKENDK